MGNFLDEIEALSQALAQAIAQLPLAEQVQALNRAREILHAVSPFKAEPVDLVTWIDAEVVGKNDYNPNYVAPPEYQLLEHSIEQDGYTQPVVAWKQDDAYEVVDGFHRSRVGKENEGVRVRVHRYLPVTQINQDRAGRSDRIAATIRHNRARGKHAVALLSEIVQELSKRQLVGRKNREGVRDERGRSPAPQADHGPG